jgi:hypothetical protein
MNAHAVATPAQSAIPLVVGVTSHRDIAAAEQPGVRERVREFFATLRRQFPALPLTVLSSLAEGGDQMVAEEALACGARLIAILPMLRAEYSLDFAEPAVRAHFETLCAASEVIELPTLEGNTLDGDADAITGGERDRHYAQAGVYVSSHCHILLAIWSGRESDRLGGTAQIVKYHLSGIKPSAVERRRFQSGYSPLGNDIERLAFHIVCSRAGASTDATPAPTLRPLQTYWRTGERILPGAGPMPSEFHTTFAHMQEFNADWAKYRVPIEAKAYLRAGRGDRKSGASA